MEIFNTIRTQQTHSAPPQGLEGAGRSTPQPQRSGGSSEQMSNQLKQAEESADTQKLKKQLQEITDQLNKEMDPLNTTIRFGFDDSIDELYVSVIDTASDKEIRKIPSEEAIRLAAKMRELVGMIFDKKG